MFDPGPLGRVVCLGRPDISGKYTSYQNLVNEVQFSEPVGVKPKASKSQMSLSQHSQHSSSRQSQGTKNYNESYYMIL